MSIKPLNIVPSGRKIPLPNYVAFVKRIFINIHINTKNGQINVYLNLNFFIKRYLLIMNIGLLFMYLYYIGFRLLGFVSSLCYSYRLINYSY